MRQNSPWSHRCAVAVIDPDNAATTARPPTKKPRPKLPPFGRHELAETVGRILRSSDTPMTAAAVANGKAIPADDQPARKIIVSRATALLNALERSGAAVGHILHHPYFINCTNLEKSNG